MDRVIANLDVGIVVAVTINEPVGVFDLNELGDGHCNGRDEEQRPVFQTLDIHRREIAAAPARGHVAGERALAKMLTKITLEVLKPMRQSHFVPSPANGSDAFVDSREVQRCMGGTASSRTLRVHRH
jgi:hypothetical protein